MKDFGELRLAWLEAFVETVDSKKRTAAAAAIGTTQSNVSKQLDKLWEWYGYPVVEPGSHPLRLTPEGTEFLKVAREVVEKLRAARPASDAPPSQPAPRISGADIKVD